MSDVRVAPQDPQAEDHVLGSMLLSPAAVDTCADILTPDDFYRPSNGHLFRAMLELHGKGEPVDVVTVTASVGRDQHVRVHELAALVPAASNVAHYARIVKDCARRRDVIRWAAQAIEKAQTAEFSLDEIEQGIYTIANSDSREADLDPGVGDYFQTLRRLRDNPGDLIGVPSGFKALDEITQGFVPGNLIVLGARPSMGKSAFALCVTAYLLGQDRPVGIVSPEMSKPEILQRLVSIGANVPGERLRDPRLMTPDEWQRALDLEERLAAKPLYVRDDGAITPLEVRAQIRRLKAKVPDLALVIVDYLQLMTTGGRHSGDNRVQEVSEISRSLKMLARDLNVPVLALSQLSRALEQRTDKRPVLADLRESGSIEQDADVVVFIYRDDYYNGLETPRSVEPVEVTVAKHRNGPTGRVVLGFKRDQARFVNPAPLRLAGDLGAVA